MTKQGFLSSVLSLGVLLLATAAAADRSDKEDKAGKDGAKLYLPVAGTGGFSGTLSIQRFEVSDGQVVAIAMVSGSLGGARTALVGQIAIPVTASLLGAGVAAPAAAAPQPAASSCGVLHLQLGAVNLDALGLMVATQPVDINLSGDSAGVLGNLVCTVLNTLNNVVGLVGLLNQLLGVLGGLTG